MSETLDSITKKNVDFVTRSISGGSISAGATGDVITLTPPTGQRVVLTHLSTTAGVSESNISVLIGGLDVTGVVSISGSSPAPLATLSVGSYQPYAAGNPPSNNHRQLAGGTGEPIVVRKNSGTTVNTLFYSYQFGE